MTGSSRCNKKSILGGLSETLRTHQATETLVKLKRFWKSEKVWGIASTLVTEPVVHREPWEVWGYQGNDAVAMTWSDPQEGARARTVRPLVEVAWKKFQH